MLKYWQWQMRPPPPAHRTLFDPTSVSSQTAVQHHAPPRLQGYGDIHAQLSYIDRIALTEIPKAQIGRDEFEAKEKLQLVLSDICRTAVYEHESVANPDFRRESVTLEKFGTLIISLSSKILPAARLTLADSIPLTARPS